MNTPAALPRYLAVLLASLAALGPFSIDTYLPSFPEMAETLHATPLQVQQTLTAYLLPFAFMSLWHGAISDALGRRRVIQWSLLVFGLASIGCALATNIEMVWGFRALQGISSGAGIVVGRAIVRDLFNGPAAQRLMSHVTMTFALAPAAAPVIGGWLHSWFGWRSVFVFLALMTAVLGLICHRWLPETLPPERRQSLAPGYLWRSYWQVLSTPAFLTATLAITANFAGFFIYVLSAPVFLLRHLGVSERAFLWLFGPAMLGMMLGSWISGRVAGLLRPVHTIALAYCVMCMAALSNVLINVALAPGLPWSVAPIFLYVVGMALAMPSLTLLALDPYPEKRGLAASCQTFLQAGGNAVVAGLIVPMLWDSTRTLAFGMSAFLGLGITAWLSYRRLTRTAGNTFPSPSESATVKPPHSRTSD